jgi:hypothetical protein
MPLVWQEKKVEFEEEYLMQKFPVSGSSDESGVIMRRGQKRPSIVDFVRGASQR